jgi:tRNA(fMet)-specific endonuclease VapC
MKYMLGTNFCIGLIRDKPEQLIRRLTPCTPGEVGVSSITIAELAYGANKSNQVGQNFSALEQFLPPIEVADFDKQASTAYGYIRTF